MSQEFEKSGQFMSLSEEIKRARGEKEYIKASTNRFRKNLGVIEAAEEKGIDRQIGEKKNQAKLIDEVVLEFLHLPDEPYWG